MRTWICCRPSDIPEISSSSASPASETCTHSVFMWKDVISPDCAPSPHPEKNWKGRWRDITGASLSEAVSPKGRPVPLPAKQTGSIFSHPISSLIRTERKKFICNLVTGPDEEPDIRSARKNMAEILLSLRRHHFLYFSAHKRRDDMEIFLEEAKKRRHTLLANGKLLQFPMNRESVSFTGTVKETQEPFFFRIYDRDLFLYLLSTLRNIRREKAEM